MNPQTRTMVVIAILLLCVFSNSHSQSVNVPLNHWAYSFLERLETRGFFSSQLLKTRPISRNDLANILAELNKKHLNEQIKLSRTEMDMFEQLKGEFYEELFQLSVRASSKYHERHFYQWKEGDSRFKIDIAFSQRFDIDRSDQSQSTVRTSRTTGGAIIRANLKTSLACYLHFWNTLVRGEEISEENFNPEFGMPTVISGANVYQDDASAYFVWQFPWFSFQFGRDQVRWGPGHQGNLLISANNPLFEMFKIRALYKRFQFTSIHGRLTSSYGRKFIAAHRIELRLFSWLHIAGSESVIYGNRGAELAYLNPIMPYHIAEHHLGDRDNNAIGFDFTLYPRTGHKFYGELFIDDFTSAENPFTYFGNKFAFQLGHHWVNPLGISDIDFRAEYTRIEPYVYTHYKSINIYQHYNQNIGHWLDPNSDHLYFETNFLINRDLIARALFERIRHGDGDIMTPHQKADGIRKSFLSGVVEKQYRWGVSITDQILRDVFLTLQINRIDFQNFNQIKGKRARDHRIVFKLTGNW